MQVIPVIDLKQGQVVRGVAGEREHYAPVRSTLCQSAAPGDVARALRDHFDFRRVYVADLDSIAGGEPNWQAYREIAAAGFALWIDAGISSESRAAALAEADLLTDDRAGIVLGLESIPGPEDVCRFAAAAGWRRAIFSLDLRAGAPVASAAWGRMSALEIAQHAYGAGIERLLALDLAGVGVNEGVPTLELLRRLRGALPNATLISGGGVRTADDIAELEEAGANYALVATALHYGRLTAGEIARAGWN